MAKVYVEEYGSLAIDGGRMAPAPQEPAITAQTVPVAGVSAQSNAFAAATRFVRVHTDAICSI